MFEYILDSRLEAIATPTEVTECRDIHCKKETRLEAIDWHTTEVLEAVQAAGEATLPYQKAGGPAKGRKPTPGFNNQVKPFKETTYFWIAVWKSAGRPINTQFTTS